MNTQKKQLLIIDDDKWTQIYETNALEEEGYTITGAADPIQGLNLAINTRPDLILLDIILPHFDGVIFLQILKNIDIIRNIPVIVVSSHLDAAIIAQAYKAGALGFISKPCSKATLVAKVNEFLVNLESGK